jgi:hypothetical protein
LITVILMDCMAAMPCDGWSRARALITKVEKAKKTPAISPQPCAEKHKTVVLRFLVGCSASGDCLANHFINFFSALGRQTHKHLCGL